MKTETEGKAQTIKFWGYRHTNGSIHLKRYFGQMDIDEAHESPFIDEVFGPWESENFEDAEKHLKAVAL